MDGDRVILGFLGLAVVLVLWAMGGAFRAAQVGSECLRLGYPHGEISLSFVSAYCIKRVDQTDVVVSLDSARALRGH